MCLPISCFVEKKKINKSQDKKFYVSFILKFVDVTLPEAGFVVVARFRLLKEEIPGCDAAG